MNFIAMVEYAAFIIPLPIFSGAINPATPSLPISASTDDIVHRESDCFDQDCTRFALPYDGNSGWYACKQSPLSLQGGNRFHSQSDRSPLAAGSRKVQTLARVSQPEMSKYSSNGKFVMKSSAQELALQLAAAIAKVVDVSVPQAAASSAWESDEDAKTFIDRRYDTFDLRGENEPLTAPELEEALRGNTVYGAPYENDPYVLAFCSNGEGRLKIRGRDVQVGTWWINGGDDTIHSKWEEAASGKDLAVRYYRTANPLVFFHEAADRNLPPVICRMCVVQSGLAI
ncbi:MAG: hypothetical protein K5905_04695 [Roseibium sp.]|uniref:hypothetical protein n=1 Tax=Roseibium sp. TaxID=1936156 RepID=UPI0026270896|nr:hypothetical protein [Roseibium sp.]MCV0424746.1 hypothetical protein [Roseibium sp.]